MRDLQHARWMWLKAVLFLVIGLVSSTMLVAETPRWRTVLFLLLVIWAFCRAYYFAFYVIQHYLDPQFRFSGLGSVVAHLWRRR
jgi:hypothetical protein